MNTLIEQAIVCEKANQFYAAIEYWSKALDVCDSENNGEGNEFGIIAYHMGHAYFHEIGVQMNLEKGCDLFVRSASVGHRGGLGMCYFLELGEFKKDLGRSLELFHQLAIEEKDTIANYMIGSILDFVDHTEKILRTVVGYNATVLFYLKEAASAGHPVAMLKLSFLYDNPVVGPSSIESVKYLKASADTGYAEAQYRYGFILQYENDRTADALEWYRKAMKQNHPSAMFEVASLYERGHAELQVACVKKNLDEAKRLYTASVCEFNIKNQCRIAKDFSNGYNRNHSTTSMTNSYEEARRRFCFAAEHGCAEAMFCLAKCYEQGKLGLQVNLHSARSWLEKAALANHPSYTVALDLAECYQNGNGVARDTDQAIYWYSHALSKIELQGGSVHARNADFRFVMDKYNKTMKTLEL